MWNECPSTTSYGCQLKSNLDSPGDSPFTLIIELWLLPTHPYTCNKLITRKSSTNRPISHAAMLDNKKLTDLDPNPDSGSLDMDPDLYCHQNLVGAQPIINHLTRSDRRAQTSSDTVYLWIRITIWNWTWNVIQWNLINFWLLDHWVLVPRPSKNLVEFKTCWDTVQNVSLHSIS